MSVAWHLFLQTLRDLRRAKPEIGINYKARLCASLIAHAQRETGFYRERLAGLIEDDGVNLERWQSIPILPPQALADAGAAIVAVERPARLGDLSDGRPPGTTGTALAGPIDALLSDADTCQWELAFEDNKLDGTKLLAEIVPAHQLLTVNPFGRDASVIEAPALRLADGARSGWSFQRPRGRAVAIDRAKPADVIAAWLCEAQPAYLLADADSIKALSAVWAIDPALRPAGLIAILAAGRLDNDTHADLYDAAEQVEAQLIAILALQETGVIATETPDGEWRPADGLCMVEIVDVAGRPVADGAAGKLVVTPFYALTRPLIRYDTGLTAAFRPGAGVKDRRFVVVGSGEA